MALDRSPGSIYIQRNCHVDCIVASQRGGSVAIEEKIVRWPGRHYTAICIETHSNLERTRETAPDGWIYTSVADYLLYAFEQEDERSLRVSVFNLPKLRDWFITYPGVFPITDDRSNIYYTTRCSVVALKKIPDDIYTLKEKMVREPKDER